MNKELILKLIERAKESAEHAYCPITNMPVGCSLLVDDNMIFGGCNIESSCNADAGEVAIFKAISQGYTKFRAICFWAENNMPYPSGKVRQLLTDFKSNLNIVVANSDTYSLLLLSDIFPFPPPEIPLE